MLNILARKSCIKLGPNLFIMILTMRHNLPPMSSVKCHLGGLCFKKEKAF